MKNSNRKLKRSPSPPNRNQSPKRWLQYSQVDLQNGLGGVEVYARSLDRELLKLGLDSKISSDPRDLSGDWDVIETHGSSPLSLSELKIVRKAGKASIAHLLHGETLGRMNAAHEWLWLGGYRAQAREWLGVQRADHVLSIHGALGLLRAARLVHKPVSIVGSGWDSAIEVESLPPEIAQTIKLTQSATLPSFCFVGRGDDPVKGTSLIDDVLRAAPEIQLFAVPGEGFRSKEQVIATGRLTPGQCLKVMQSSRGLLLTSYYEGLPLVVLEALGWGIPVFATQVGGLKTLPADLLGLTWLTRNRESWVRTLRAVPAETDPSIRSARAAYNRSRMRSWKQVAIDSIEAVFAGNPSQKQVQSTLKG